MSGNSVRAIFEDREGTLWIGTESGLNSLRDDRFTVYTIRDGLSHDNVRAITQDREGNLWLGTYGGGLNRLREGKFISFTARDGLSNDHIWVNLEDREGNLWVGTWNGLDRFNKSRFTAITSADGLSNDYVWSIYEDRAGGIWIGTDGGGLNRLKDGRITRYTTKDGLFDDVVMAILEDDAGNFWMSCNRGIFRASRRELNDFADGRVRSIGCVAYGTADGMTSSACNGVSQPSVTRTRDGRLWFPTVKGVVIIDPRHIPTNAMPPPVAIEEVVVDAVTVNKGNRQSGATFAPGAERFEFHYTGLSFVAPERVRFRYMLEGLDHDWVDAGARRVAYYNNLAPGDYRFRVLAANNDGVWNEEGASLSFHVQPRFYQTYPFYLMCVALAGLIVWSLYRLRVRQVEQRYSARGGGASARGARHARHAHTRRGRRSNTIGSRRADDSGRAATSRRVFGASAHAAPPNPE